MQLLMSFKDESEGVLSKLTVTLDDLLQRGVVEKERLEYKKGWNPEEVLHTLCAFANDFYNLDGGYIVIGIATNSDGEPILPPAGLPENQLDQISRKVTELGHKIAPHYHAVGEFCTVQGRKILVLRAAGGENRPYKAPIRLGDKHREMAYYIRRNSCTMRVISQQDELELVNLANKIPHDDRLNQRAQITDLELNLIGKYLQRVGSGLSTKITELSLEDLGLRLNIVGGPVEARYPINVGLMFFNSHPELFFPQTQIDVVQFPDGVAGDRIIEKTFVGPISVQLMDALAYLQNNVLEEITVKQEGRAEASRVWNYPYAALEEILPNAIYHRSYDEREPIEVRVEPTRIVVTSYPGPDASINMEALMQGRLSARRYRNRRIGEFLKELELTEGRSTGIPKVIRTMQNNGSPPPEFDTDEKRTYFTAILPINPVFLDTDFIQNSQSSLGNDWGNVTQVTTQVRNKDEITLREILRFCTTAQSRSAIQGVAELKSPKQLRKKYLHPLLEKGWLEQTHPENLTSPLQKYRTTAAGLDYLKSAP